MSTFSAWRVAAGGQLADELGVDRRLELEVELLERLHDREVGDLDPHGDTLALLEATSSSSRRSRKSR
jgi:hypothetical protein